MDEGKRAPTCSSSCSPVFPGLFEFCSRYTGASLQGATQLNNKVTIAPSPISPFLWVPESKALTLIQSSQLWRWAGEGL